MIIPGFIDDLQHIAFKNGYTYIATLIIQMDCYISVLKNQTKKRIIYLPANLPSDQPIIAPWGPPLIPESKISVIMNSID